MNSDLERRMRKEFDAMVEKNGGEPIRAVGIKDPYYSPWTNQSDRQRNRLKMQKIRAKTANSDTT